MDSIVFSSWKDVIVDNRGKAAQDCQAVATIDLPEQFNQNKNLKALLGWSGIVIRSETVAMLPLLKAYLHALSKASCGKCTPCRVGTNLMAGILGRLCDGNGTLADCENLRDLAQLIRETSKCYIGQSGPIPVLHALDHFRDAFVEAVRNGGCTGDEDYRSKLTAPCMDACPIHLDIPAYVEGIREARYKDSLAIIRQKLPIPGIVGRVCFRPCEKKCRRANMDEAISIKYLKRFVADHELAKRRRPNFGVEAASTTGKVAIIGAGPAGVTCAYHLARKGHKVTIFENLDGPGGMSYVGIPDYRLPIHILKGEVTAIQKMGVEIRYNTQVGRDVSLAELEESHDAVFIAIGCHASTPMRVEGEDAGYDGFIPGVKFLLDVNQDRDPYPEGKHVVVVGGGNVAIDCVRSAFRVGKKDVTLLYRRTKKEMPADPVEIRDAEEEKVVFEYLTAPKRVVAENNKVIGLECIRMKLGAPDESGRRRPVPIEGSEYIVDCDIVIPAIGQRVNIALVEGVEGLEMTPWQTFVVDETTKQTSRPKLFAAGDCETGPGALITACAGGRKAARSIHRLICGEPLVQDNDEEPFDELFRTVHVYDAEEKIEGVGTLARQQLTHLPPETRKTSFDEVEKGFSTPQARAEACRCLRCYCVATVAL
jgi:formate dehydrogenase beta subunit